MKLRLAYLILLLLPVVNLAQNAANDSLAQVGPKGILFNGVVQDSSFAPGEKLYVEILETGDAVETTLGAAFSITLPEDTLWNVCVTNSDTSGAAKEKCYELVYQGDDSTFSHVLGDGGLTDANDVDSAGNKPKELADAEGVASDVAQGSAEPREQNGENPEASNQEDVDVDALLAAGGGGKVTEMKKVVVQLRRRPKRKAGESVVSTKSIKRMPGLGEADVIRSIQQLPGVVASSDFSTKIYVRGGAADQNLFLYDNAVVYSPTHFFGLFSTFLVETIDDVQFYKSGFPAQYGNRLSSVLKMDGRAGGQDSVDEWLSKTSIKVSTFAAQLHTEGHVGNARWVVAGRTTYIGIMMDLFNFIGLLDMDLDYAFTDLQGTFMYEFSPDTRVKASFYVGNDDLSFDPLFISWGNIAVPVNFIHRIDDNWEYNATLAFSRFYQDMEISDLINLGMDLYTFVGKQWLNFRGITDHIFTLGYELEYDYDKFWEYIASTKVTDTQKPFHHVAYLQDAWNLDPSATLQLGLRFNYQTLSEHFGVEPRASFTWHLADNKTFELYGGYYLQYMNSIMFSDQESLNEFYYPAVTTTKGRHLKPASSWLFAAEYTQRGIFNQYDATVGVYYKTQNNLNTFVMRQDSTEETSSTDFVMADYFGTAQGYSLGYELSLRKDKGWWFGGVNWSQSLSVLKTDDGTDAYYPSWHQPYALKLDAGINWKGDEESLWPHKRKGRYFRSSFVLKYSAGMPITEKAGYFYANERNSKDFSDNIMVLNGSRNAARQTNYFRLDVKAIDIGRENKWNFSWTIINLLDHDNMFYSYYDTSVNPPEYKTISQFPFLPVMVNYEYYF